jgi:2-(1,2-epoxy-1,2-dihydrophenyl)acetyl-CoA isomerase
MSEQPFVTVSDAGSVRTITMSNPGRRNAIPEAGWAELEAALEGFERSEMRVMVLRGAGTDFCSGADLSESPARDFSSAADNLSLMRRTSAAALCLASLSKPTIAAVRGVAVGAGMNLAIGCDVVLAAADARFAEIFVMRGLAMDMGGTWLLPRRVGAARAAELALTGRIVQADEALDIGLVAAVVPADELDAAVATRARAMARGAPLAQRFVKVGLHRSGSMTFEQAIAFENQAQAVLFASEDAREGIRSFLEKRDPRFRGR